MHRRHGSSRGGNTHSVVAPTEFNSSKGLLAFITVAGMCMAGAVVGACMVGAVVWGHAQSVQW